MFYRCVQIIIQIPLYALHSRLPDYPSTTVAHPWREICVSVIPSAVGIVIQINYANSKQYLLTSRIFYFFFGFGCVCVLVVHRAIRITKKKKTLERHRPTCIKTIRNQY